MLKHIAYAAGALLLSATSAMAATADGTQGATSTGTIDISIQILEEVNILGLTTDWGAGAGNGIDFGVWDSSSVANETQTISVCVYRNNGTDYDVTADTTAAGNAFLLEGALVPANTIAFTVDWDTAGVNQALTATTPFTASTGDNDPTCSGLFPINVLFTIPNANLAAQTNQDTYSTQVNFQIDPQ
ncbi:MAG: hypothetical protein GC134_09280 [Proteobacteria bacterium]|nr:hypothetical protein [Pseudomonadota bacterium]